MTTAISQTHQGAMHNIQKEEDLVSIQNEQLKQGKIRFLTSLQPDVSNCYGMKNKSRELEPSMKDIFSWGYEAPVKEDYVKDNKEIRYKIRKMDTEYISEVHDNYRRPEQTDEKGVFLFNFLDQQGQEKWKQKVYEMAVKDESEQVKQSTYRQLFCGQENQWWEQIMRQVTPAGKTSYKEKPTSLITPEQFIRQKMEEKIKEIILKNRALNPNDKASQDTLGKTSSRGLGAKGPGETNNVQVMVDPVEQAEREAARQKRQQEKKALKRAQTAKSKRNLEKRLNDVKSTSRWLADSAITTYFGRPAFHPYGNGNTKPTVGGVICGDYLKTHNINPQSGDNHPEFKQVFGRAMLGATIEVKGPKQNSKSPKRKGVRQPTLPRKVRDDCRLTPGQVDEIKARNPIMPIKNENTELDHVHIEKPDLTKQKYLQSKHTTPTESQNQSTYELQPQQTLKQGPLNIHQQYEQMKSLNVSKSSSHTNLPPNINQNLQNTLNLSNMNANPQQIEYYKGNATHLDGFKKPYENEQVKEQTLAPGSNVYQTINYAHQNIQQTQKINQQHQQPQLTQSLIQPHQHSQFCGHKASQVEMDKPFSQQNIPFCPLHGAVDQPEFLHLLDPKNYKLLPHHYTESIRSAGKFTHKSEKLGNLLSWKDDE